MEKILKNRCFFNLLSLIFIVSFLFFPKIILAEDVSEIKLENYGKYLELPEDKTKELIKSLVQVFNSEWINLESSAYSTAEQRAVPIIMRKAIRVQALSHLLKEAPLEVAGKIIKNSVKIARIFLIKDISGILDKIEKESVRRAINYGTNALLQDEIKVAPGVVSFNYKTQDNNQKEASFQYILIYKPTSAKTGDIKIRFYSPFSIEKPKSEGSMGGLTGTPNDLTRDLPPFIVDVQGHLKDYKWKESPLVEIYFPDSVPDLGIKPLSLKEKYILKPIESTIKEVEIIITKITGQAPKIMSVWDKIKSAVSKIKSFLPAAVSITQPELEDNKAKDLSSNISNIATLSDNLSLQIDLSSQEEVFEKHEEKGFPVEKKMTLEEIQEILDDISEKIDIIGQQIAELTEANANQIVLTEIKKEVKGASDEIEEIIEDNEVIEDNEATEGDGGIEAYSYHGALLCSNLDQSPQYKAIINEIAWMGTVSSANDEWIELKNMSGSPMDIIGWQLLSKDGGIRIVFDNSEKSVPLNILFLLERTDDDSVSHKTADFIYTGAISNTNEMLYLFDANCRLQDEISANPDWPAGNNSSKRTMERTSGFGWQTSFSSGGTPKEENSIGYYEYASGGSSSGSGDNSSSPQQSSSEEGEISVCSLEDTEESTHSPIVINEIAWMGSGSSSADEWIELKNVSTSTVYLNNWQLIGLNAENSENKIEMIFGENDFIATSSFYLLERTDDESVPGISADKIFTGSINDSDFSLRLFNQNCGLIDEILATSTWPAGQKSPERKTMERRNDFNWQTSFSTTSINDLFGTPKAENSEGNLSEEQEATLTEEIDPFSVVINEIAWMGAGPDKSSDEWIELYNNTDSDINLANWEILKGGEDFINISTSTGTTIIPALGFFLLERTASDTTNLIEDQIYSGGLRNEEGEKLELRTENNVLMDTVDCSFGWFAGTSSPYYISMERISSSVSGTSSDNWADNNLIIRNGLSANLTNINGTPKSKNSVSYSSTTITSLPFDEFSEIKLSYFGSPYILKGYLDIAQDKVLNIDPGVVIKSYSYGGFRVNGILNADGQSDKKIVFTSINESIWRGIIFDSPGKESRIDWAEIKHGRIGEGEAPAVSVSYGKVFITNSLFSNYWDRGLELYKSDSVIENTNFYGSGIPNSTVGIEINGGSPIIKNCGMIKNNRHGIFINGLLENDLPIIDGNNFEENENPIYSLGVNVTFKGNKGKNNLKNFIIINGTMSANDLTWYKNELPYFVTTNINILYGKKLNVDPGVTVTLKGGAYVAINGTLVARGTETESIIFTGNGWCRLDFSASNTNSVLENVIVSGGGYCSSQSGQILVSNSTIEILNSTSTNSGDAGIYLFESSSIIKNSSSVNNRYGIYINTDHERCPVVENFIIEGNKFKSYSSCILCNEQMGFCSSTVCY